MEIHFRKILNICFLFDLQPENILLDNSFNVKITDFGFAKILLNDQKLYGKFSCK